MLSSRTITVSYEVKKHLRRIAQEEGISVNQLINNLIIDSLGTQYNIPVYRSQIGRPQSIPESKLVFLYERGLSDKQIGEICKISPKAVSMQLSKLRAKGRINYRRSMR